MNSCCNDLSFWGSSTNDRLLVLVSVSVLILSVPGVRGVAEHARCEEVRVAVPDPGHLQVNTVTLGNRLIEVFEFMDKEVCSYSL